MIKTNYHKSVIVDCVSRSMDLRSILAWLSESMPDYRTNLDTVTPKPWCVRRGKDVYVYGKDKSFSVVGRLTFVKNPE